MSKEENRMGVYLICAVIWIVNVKFIIQAVREHNESEMYEHFGLPIYLTLVVVGSSKPHIGYIFSEISWLKIIGFIFFIPAAFLVVVPIIGLERKGKSQTSASPILAPSDAKIMLDTGIFSIIRHPLYLGTALWSVALILVFQSFLSIILGGIAIFCFVLASKKEDEFNTKKFGDKYKDYMRRVPMWNVFKGIKR
jgi:protein-S-isoprenylcysteine O-methyltransferase Ste14